MAFPSRSFLCLRHGTTDWNRQGRFQGLTDNALNADGIAEAHAAARRLAGVAVAAIVASPLRRAVQTAEVVAATLSKDISIDITTILPADGEPWPAVSERALRCVAAWQQRHPRADILFVCHDGVMQAMAEVLCGGFFENHHETPFRYARTGTGWKLEQIG